MKKLKPKTPASRPEPLGPGADREGVCMMVELSQSEMAVAAFVGGARRCESRTRGRPNSNGFKVEREWDYDIEGAAAEMAYCKARGKYWDASVGSFKEADCAGNVQVRHTGRPGGRLIIRKDDNPDHYYVLVVGRSPEFWVIGWIKGAEAMKPVFLDNPGGIEESYFVPQSALRPF